MELKRVRLPGDRVRVPREVFQGIEAVRQSGLTNMLDRPVVAQVAEEMGFEESARWVREHRDLYVRAIFHGFEVEGGSPPAPAGGEAQAGTEGA